MIWIFLIIFVLPAALIIRAMGRANGWLYETLRLFFNESLEGTRHQGSMSRLLAGIGAIILGILGFLLILWIF